MIGSFEYARKTENFHFHSVLADLQTAERKHYVSGVGAYLLVCELTTLAQKGASQTLARLAYFRVPSHHIA